MDASILVAIISGVGTILVAAVGFMGAQKGTLASAEQNFRTTIIQENEKLRKRIDELEGENRVLQKGLLEMQTAMTKAGLVSTDEEEKKEDE
ncbi:hypothetical protein ACK8P5_26680 (plasmid) [Paenibacillus sp. EC2-1]|uniref:hypothetical protein n=1 Tax=Paenibacillus sp. EC2-1 TaxID=3388665 RepID=UPI003BEED527